MAAYFCYGFRDSYTSIFLTDVESLERNAWLEN